MWSVKQLPNYLAKHGLDITGFLLKSNVTKRFGFCVCLLQLALPDLLGYLFCVSSEHPSNGFTLHKLSKLPLTLDKDTQCREQLLLLALLSRTSQATQPVGTNMSGICVMQCLMWFCDFFHWILNHSLSYIGVISENFVLLNCLIPPKAITAYSEITEVYPGLPRLGFYSSWHGKSVRKKYTAEVLLQKTLTFSRSPDDICNYGTAPFLTWDERNKHMIYVSQKCCSFYFDSWQLVLLNIHLYLSFRKSLIPPSAISA